MLREKRVPITYLPGMHPVPDSTELASSRIVAGNRIRFLGGKVKQLGGWLKQQFDQLGENLSVSGCPRLLYSFIKATDSWAIIGTHSNLYAIKNNLLTNISPLVTATTALGTDPLTSIYDTDNNVFTTTNGTKFVKLKSVLDSSLSYVGQTFKVANVAVTVNGVPAAELNGEHKILYFDSGFPVFSVTTAATSSGTGGGVGIIINAKGFWVFDSAHGLSTGQRIKLAGSSNVAGINATEINKEHVITVINSNEYIINTSSYPTSAAGGGGAAVTRQAQISAGECDNGTGAGYGMGLYGLGLYGVSKTAYNASSIKALRIWSCDRYGDNIVLTPGNQTNLYQWTVTTATAPTPVTAGSAPTAINYVFVTDNFVCVLGPGGTENKVQWCDQGDIGDWVPAADNYAGSQTLRNAGKLLTHVNVRGVNLVFSKNVIYSMRYVPGSQYVFKFDDMGASEGIIGQNARAAHEGAAYWMGNDSFYKYEGGVISEVGRPEDQDFNSVKHYVFSRLTSNQREKVCCGVVREFNEIWWFYPSSTSANANGYNENDSYVIYSIEGKWWATGDLARSAIEYPKKIYPNQYMISPTGTLYKHEIGVDDDTSPMNAYADLRIVMTEAGDQYTEITGFMPDLIMSGTVQVTYYTRRSPAGTQRTYGPYSITGTTELKRLRAYGRQRKVRIATNSVGSDFQMGDFFEYMKAGGRR